MHCLRCGKCCEETEMLLSNKDIDRLERKGYQKNFFVRFDSEGYAILQNQNGVCVFFNLKTQTCRERKNRPSGCKIYPIIYDEDKGIIIDDICPAKNTISEKQKANKGKRVLKLLDRIDSEAKERRSLY